MSSDNLGELQKMLAKKYPGLSITQNISTNQEQQEVAYLHLWKPKPLSTGLSFLPTFHIIILPQDNDPGSPDLTVQLMTFHGKVILEDQITAPDGKILKGDDGSPSGFDIIQSLADDKYLLCAGIDKVNKKRLIKCLRRLKATHLDKVRNFFLVETQNEDSVLRTKRCLFAVTEEEELERRQREAEEDGEDYIPNPDPSKRCIECEKFQFRIQRLRREMDGDDEVLKDTETLLEEGLFRVMKDDNRALYWTDTVVYSGKKIQPLDVKNERGQMDSDDEDWSPSEAGKRGRKRGSKSSSVSGTVKKERIEDKEEFAMTCTICLHTYPSMNSYEIDQRRHAKAFDLRELVACPLCESLDPMEKKDLTVHFHDYHPDRGTCCCECLEIMSPEDDALRKHMLKYHSEALKTKCPMCPTTFTEKYRLKVHIKQMHEKTAEAICDHCGKLFGHRSLMVKHRRLAHGAKTFICTICEKGFTSIFALNKHLNVHSGLKPFKCIDCDYRSCRLTNVWLHVKKMHNRKGTHADVEVFEDELKQMQAMELDNVPYKPPEYGEGLEELDEVYVQEDDIQAEEIQEEIQTEIHVIQELQVEDEQ